MCCYCYHRFEIYQQKRFSMPEHSSKKRPAPTRLDVPFSDEIPNSTKSINIDMIQNVAHNKGLSSHLLLSLISVIESKKFEINIKVTLISCLIPRCSVPDIAYIRMTRLLSDFKIESKLKVEILKWMIAVFPFMENLPFSSFQSLYEIFLQLLEYEVLRPYVCNFLHLITGKHNVTLRRINYIGQLLERLEPEPCLTALLHLYTSLQSNIFSVSLTEEFQHDFEPLGIYREAMEKVRGCNSFYLNTHVFVGEKNDTLTCRSFHNEAEDSNCGAISNESESISGATYSVRHSPESENIFGATYSVRHSPESENVSRTIYNMQHSPEPNAINKDTKEMNIKQSLIYNSFEDMYVDFKPIKNSHDMQQILKSKFRRLFLTSDIPLAVRISFFDYVLSSLYSGYDSDFLSNVVEIIHEMQESSSALSDFINNLIEFWDGYSDFHTVLEIMSYQEICCFNKIGYSMDCFRELLLKAPILHKCEFLYCFTKIYQNWTVMKCDRYGFVPCDGDNCTDASEKDCPSSESQYHSSINELHKLGSYIDLICDALISEKHYHSCLLNQVLHHYERISIAHTKNENVVLHLPTSSTFCTALFSLNSYTLNNLSRLMLRYNIEVYSLLENNHSEAQLAALHLKSCFTDLYNILWKGGQNCAQNAKTFLSQRRITKRLKELHPNFKNLFIFYKHPALLLRTNCFFEHNELNSLHIPTMNLPTDLGYFQYLFKDDLEELMKLINIFSHKTKK